jgi:hypothetical protein
LSIRHYILIEHEVIPAKLLEWARWFETADRTVAYTITTPGVEVSTVFLPLEPLQSLMKKLDPPIHFETRVFGGEHDDYTRRYCSWDDALKGHWEVVGMVKKI